jgi:two-component system LytT family sensor kinase
MKKKTGLLVIAFVLFYSMIHLGRYLPDLYTGKFTLVDERSYDRRLLSLLADMSLSCLFALSAYYALYFYYPAKNYVLMLVALTVAFIACFVVGYIAERAWAEGYVRLSVFFREHVLYNAFYTIFAMVFYFVRYAQFTELMQRDLAIRNREAELSYLRSQINPHFLFNNLNNIYSMVYHQSDQSLAAISGLSEMLRYMLYDTGDAISLEKEVHFVEKYIALEQLRFEHPSKINFSYAGDMHRVWISPLLFIPFIENAFKHGDISGNGTWLDISINADPDRLIFKCSNLIGTKLKDKTGGIGIDNVSKRLALLYPGRHSLAINTEGNKFIVDLRLDLPTQANR